MKFESKRSFFLPAIIALLLSTVIAVAILEDVSGWELVGIGVSFLIPIALLLWFFFSTYYVISDGNLSYVSGFLAGTIPIKKIRRIEIGKIMFVGLRPALSFDGMIIHYNKWDKIYVSPHDKDQFVKSLLSENASIEIVNNKK